MNQTLIRNDDRDIRRRLAEYGIGISTSFSGSPVGSEISVEVSGADRVIQRGPVGEKTSDQLPLGLHIRDASALAVTADCKLATVLIVNLEHHRALRSQLPDDARHLLLFGEAHDGRVGANRTYIKIYGPIH